MTLGEEARKYWAKFGYCETCDQAEGAPCWDLRYGRSSHDRHFFRLRPHKGRPRLDRAQEVVDE